ncbi:hypothetical protein [Halosegnis longus]|uniref:hypothetical protein n=1 Tax=Halosegnis longus TaxID=2216012 RepID=UPI00129E23B1|nr:hypothetical protein [Halosegnis longus]
MTASRVGAVLYDHTPGPARLAHVIDETETDGPTRYTLTDATHTQTRYCDGPTLQTEYVPAGWQWPITEPPLRAWPQPSFAPATRVIRGP